MRISEYRVNSCTHSSLSASGRLLNFSLSLSPSQIQFVLNRTAAPILIHRAPCPRPKLVAIHSAARFAHSLLLARSPPDKSAVLIALHPVHYLSASRPYRIRYIKCAGCLRNYGAASKCVQIRTNVNDECGFAIEKRRFN